MHVKYIIPLILISTLAACGGGGKTGPIKPVQNVQTVTPSGFEGQEQNLINQYRMQNGKTQLQTDPRLTQLAQAHSQDMANRHSMDHNGFDQRFKQAQGYGYTHCVENVAFNYNDPQSLFNAWRNSPEHNANMLNSDIRYSGIAIVNGYATFDACN